MRYKDLFAWMKERHAICTRREAGKPKPWTTDPILQSYRFCNVYRELDTVTQWIASNWRQPWAHDRDLWFAMVVARLVNWPDTLFTLESAIYRGGSVQWYPLAFVKQMHRRRDAGEKVFSGAYIVSTNGHKMDKAEYLAEHVLTPLWQARAQVRPREGDTLASFHARLMEFDGMGSFMAAQVVADVKYTPGGVLLGAPDWWTWAASGPGSRRGLNRVCGFSVDDPWREERWLEDLSALQTSVDRLMAKAKMPRLHAQDLQNCLCEFDKYERVRLGEGKPRSLYPGV